MDWKRKIETRLGNFPANAKSKLIKDKNFPLSMTEVEKDAWDAFVKVLQNFLGNERAHNYIELMNNLLDKLHKLHINMSIKVHFVVNHLDILVLSAMNRARGSNRILRWRRRDIKAVGVLTWWLITVATWCVIALMWNILENQKNWSLCQMLPCMLLYIYLVIPLYVCYVMINWTCILIVFFSYLGHWECIILP